MRIRIILSALLLNVLALGFASAKSAASSDQLHTFYGEVQAVDLAAKTLTIKSAGKSFVFHYTDETKISSLNGYITWNKVRPGQGATVVMRLGEGNVGIAVMVRFDASAGLAPALALYSARTVRGENITGIAVSNFVAYEPPSDRFIRAIDLGRARTGMFLLAVRSDGTVGNVQALQAFSHPELNERAAIWLKQWRFHPNSVTEVRMPVFAGRLN